MKPIENFIDTIVSTGQEIIDKPGFIVCKVTNSNKPLYLRELILPEIIFIFLEKEIEKKYGNIGLNNLYQAGREFGYEYSKISDFVIYNKKNDKEFIEFFEFFMNYMKSWWMSNYKYSIDLQTRKVELELSDYVICRKSGIGKIIKEGCMSGFFSYLFDDKTIEPKQLSCKGRGGKICQVVYSPHASQKEIDFDKKERKFDESVYNSINEIKQIDYGRTSFKDLLYSNIVKYKNGKLTIYDMRFFLIGSNFLYTIEKKMKSLDNGKILYESSKLAGKKIAERNKNLQGVFDLLSSFGWGDFFLLEGENKILLCINYYPWFEDIDKSYFKLICGLLAGVLSCIKENNVDLQVEDIEILEKCMVRLVEKNEK